MTLTRLEGAKLVTVNRDPSGALTSLDTHPLLREYFAQERRTRHIEAWSTAHRRLFEHLCATTPDEPKPTLENLQPLYQALSHGCQAGLHQEACDQVYKRRIQRGKQAYSTNKLGALGSDLAAVACFFDTRWSGVSAKLTEVTRAWILNEAATRLRALGRLTEALEPMRAGLRCYVREEQWTHAAVMASNLSELELILGGVIAAVREAKLSVTYSEYQGPAHWRMGTRTVHADALHQAGLLTEAETIFCEAEKIQEEDQPSRPLMYSVSGFRYCEKLLRESERSAWRAILGMRNCPHSPADQLSSERAEENTTAYRFMCRAVFARATRTLEWMYATSGAPLLTIALNRLTIGRSILYETVLDCGVQGPLCFPIDKKNTENCAIHLSAAVNGLRNSGDTTFIPRGLLTRAWLQSIMGYGTGLDSAESDLDEAWEIAERGPMPLHMADIHLHRARLFFREAKYPWGSPQHDLAEARLLILKHGYLRRKEELEDAEAVVLHRT